MQTQSAPGHAATRRDLLELAAGYAEESVIVTTAEMELPGPTIVYVNTAFTRMTGYSAAELIGETPRLLQGPGTNRQTLDDLKSTITAGDDFIARATNYRRDGTPFEIEWIIKHLRNEDGVTTHYVAVQRDITGIERAEEGLAQFDEELRVLGARLIETVENLAQTERRLAAAQRMEALGRMARGVSHDLMNSLAPMSLILEVAEAEDGLDAPMLERLELLRTNLDHALTLTRRISEFGGTDDDRSPETVGVRRTIGDVVDLTKLQRSAGPKIDIEVSAPDGLTVVVDPIDFRRVLLNLAINAIDAMPDGGTLEFRATESSGEVVVEVEDSGHGMDKPTLEHCFEPFFTTGDSGHGLGLSICHGVVERLGGSIDVASEPGRGTTFSVRLPAI